MAGYYDYGFQRLGSALQNLGRGIEDGVEKRRLNKTRSFFDKELLALGEATPTWSKDYKEQATSFINAEIDKQRGQRRGISRGRYADSWATLRAGSLLQVEKNYRAATGKRAGELTNQWTRDAAARLEFGTGGAAADREKLAADIQGLEGIDAATRESLSNEALSVFDRNLTSAEAGEDTLAQGNFVGILAEAFRENDSESKLETRFGRPARYSGALPDLFKLCP